MNELNGYGLGERSIHEFSATVNGRAYTFHKYMRVN